MMESLAYKIPIVFLGTVLMMFVAKVLAMVCVGLATEQEPSVRVLRYSMHTILILALAKCDATREAIVLARLPSIPM